MLKNIKILLVLLSLLISDTSSALIDVKEFKLLCNFANEEKINNFAQKLAKTDTSDFQLWIASFDAIYPSPLIYATHKNNIPIIKLLINACIKRDINFWEITDSDGKSLLSIAAGEQYIDVIKLLLKYKHPVYMDEANITSALHQAAMKPNTEICNLIIEQNSKLIHCKDIHLRTPINYLIDKSLEHYVLDLLERFPVHKKMIPLDINGRSYLHHAVINYMYDVVNYLLEKGFDYNQKDYSGVTPLGLSKYQQDETILRILEAEDKNRKQKYCCCFRNILLRSHSNDIIFSSLKQNYKFIDN
jgi:ankyrin repeat protein